MRPAYETDKDRSKEREVADTLQQLWNCTFIKTPRFYGFDYTITRDGAAVAFCEIKCRSRKYDTLLLSLHKRTAGIQLSLNTGLPFMVVASVPEGVFWYEVKGRPHSIIVNGRRDRGDPDDVEPCVLLPYSDFRRAL